MKMVGQRTTRFMVLVVTHGNGKLQSIDDVEKKTIGHFPLPRLITGSGRLKLKGSHLADFQRTKCMQLGRQVACLASHS